MKRTPWIIAHRGSSARHPENTHAAFEAALDAGADGIELDLQLSRDGVVVAHHDRTLKRTTGVRRRVADLDAADIARLDAGAWKNRRFRGEPVPTLQQILERYAARTTLLLELKPEPDRRGWPSRLARAVADLVVAHRARDVFILSFHVPSLTAGRRHAPELQYALNLARRPDDGANLRARLGRYAALVLPGRAVTPQLVDTAADCNTLVLPYLCDVPRVALRAAAAGVAGLMADDPAALRTVVETRPA